MIRIKQTFLLDCKHKSWIYDALWMEVVAKLMRHIYPQSSPLETTFRTIVWGLLTIYLLWRYLCRYSWTWWVLDCFAIDPSAWSQKMATLMRKLSTCLQVLRRQCCDAIQSIFQECTIDLARRLLSSLFDSTFQLGTKIARRGLIIFWGRSRWDNGQGDRSGQAPVGLTMEREIEITEDMPRACGEREKHA